MEIKTKKILSNNGNCIDKCENENTHKCEYNGKCYENCSNGYLTDDNNNPINKCKCQLEKCESCPKVVLNKDLCTKCNKDFYSIENDPANNREYIDCYKGPFKGYYIDKDEQMFKKCYFTCEDCEIKGKYTFNNGLECNSNFTFNISFNNYINCYEKCPHYYISIMIIIIIVQLMIFVQMIILIYQKINWNVLKMALKI